MTKHDRAEQHNLTDQMPDKVKELAAAWQAKADSFIELRRNEEESIGSLSSDDRPGNNGR